MNDYKNTIKVRYYPPSWFQILYQDKVIYIDPSFMKTLYADHFKALGYKNNDPFDGLPMKELSKADIILLTHNHADHCNNDTISKLITDKTVIIGTKNCQKKLTVEITTIESGEVIIIDNIVIKAVPSYNTPEGRSTRKVHKKGDCVGYIIEINSKKIYHAGDTDFIQEMDELKDRIDLALVPIGGSFTLDTKEAIETILYIKPKITIPMHYKKGGDYNLFKEEIEKHPITKVVILDVGGEFNF